MKKIIASTKKILVYFILVFVISCFVGCASEQLDAGMDKVEPVVAPIILGEMDYYGKINVPNGEMNDCTFVDSELWLFYASDDEHEQYSYIYRYNVDIENKAFDYIGKIKHNLGHCNTVDYCSENDTLILGNGGQGSEIINNQIYLIENASRLRDCKDMNIYDTAKIIELSDVDVDFGRQVNVCWGESNNEKSNIIYVLSNMNEKKYIRKIILGKGNNQLDFGEMIEADENSFNGTFKIICEFTKDYSTDYCNQGTQYSKGKLYEALGHRGITIGVNSLLSNGEILTDIFRWEFYEDDGTVDSNTFVEGIAIKDGYLFVGLYNYYLDKKMLIYKL